MEGRDCTSRRAGAGCQSTQDTQTVQPFPSGGRLGRDLGPPLPLPAPRLRRLNRSTYPYVVRTVKWARETAAFEQHGSAPNSQGDALTLCTCKHQMRASRAAGDWGGVWLAGFTSRTLLDGKH